MRMNKLTSALAIAGLCTVSAAAFATNGYFAHGYGTTGQSMGGAATAMSEDTFGGANNPASMVWVGNRLDGGLEYFRPTRSAKRVGSAFGGAYDFNQDSGSKDFVIPSFGFNYMWSKDLSLGVSVYGNGGMNTNYKGNTNAQIACEGSGSTALIRNGLCGPGRLGVDLSQLIIAPTLAYKLNSEHSIGISPLIGYQRFAAKGLQAFTQISNDPTNTSNKGYDDAFGIGVRVGWQGHITNTLTIGAAYASKIYMEKFSKYSGLFAEGGSFDIPENFSVGAAWKATPELTIAADYQRINYDGVASIHNSSQTPGCFGTGSSSSCLGGSNGIGFGWQSINVYKLGAEYQVNSNVKLRAGYNHGDNPIRSQDVTFNILAPGVVQDHLTLGMSYALSPKSELSWSYLHAFNKSVTGPSNATNARFGGTETIKLHEDSFGISYSMKY